MSPGSAAIRGPTLLGIGERLIQLDAGLMRWPLAIPAEIDYNRAMESNHALRARFELPLPPGINQQYATVQGRRVLSRASRAYKQTVRQAMERLRATDLLPESLVDALRRSYIGLFIDFHFESPYRRDLDGGLKIAQDAICEALEINDNRVVDVHLVKRLDPLHPRIEVEIEAIPHWDFDLQYVYMGNRDGEAGQDED